MAGPANWSARSIRRCDSGNMAVISALVLPVVAMFLVFGVDEGSLFFEKRKQQTATDIAAIVAVSEIAQAERAARLSLADNAILGSAGDLVAGNAVEAGEPGIAVKVDVGHYTRDRSLAAAERFIAGAAQPNAVKVTVERPGTLFFGARFRDPPVFRTSAVASTSAQAAFSIGSRLASLDGGIVNAMLDGLLGTSLSLRAMDYEALAQAQVDVMPFLDKLASKLSLKAGTYDELLDSSLQLSDLADVMAKVANGNADATAALREISRQTDVAGISVPLRSVFDLGTLGPLAVGSAGNGMSVTASVWDIVMAGAVIGGDHQFALNLGAIIPGLASVKADVTIGERPQHSAWLSVGDAGTLLRTAQTRLRLVVQAGGTGLLSGLTVRLPIYLDLAQAEGRLEEIACVPGHALPTSVTVAARPGVIDAYIGEVSPADLKHLDTSVNVAQATFVNTALIKIRGLAHAEMANLSFENLVFDSSAFGSTDPQSVSTHDFTGSLTQSLVGDLSLSVDVVGLSAATPAALRDAAATSLLALASPVDALLANVLNALGLRLGEADVWVNGARCGNPVLVQ